MKIILLQDVKGTGRKGEVREVKDGFARNFLIAKDLAKLATAENLNHHQQEINHHQAEENHKQQELEQHIQLVNSLTLEHPLKVGKNGSVFNAVNKQVIRDFLKEKGVAVEKDGIELEESLKELGEYRIKISLGREVKANLKVSVISQQ